MATDATGTPTSPDNIPKFNTAVDAPSGLGTNAMMDAIQTALNNRPSTPVGITSGEAMVWNGVSWVRSSITPITANGLSGVVKTPPYRKTTTKQVVNTTTETDLLNGEITIAGNAIGVNGVARLTAWGDLINNTGGTVASPRYKVKLGATTLIDTNIVAASWATASVRLGWRIVVEIMNLGTTGSQWVSFDAKWAASTTTATATFTTGEGTLAYTGQNNAYAIGTTSSSVDTTAAQALALTVTLPTANALEDVTLKGAIVELL